MNVVLLVADCLGFDLRFCIVCGYLWCCPFGLWFERLRWCCFVTRVGGFRAPGGFPGS